MFPSPVVSVTGLDPDATYSLKMEIVPAETQATVAADVRTRMYCHVTAATMRGRVSVVANAELAAHSQICWPASPEIRVRLVNSSVFSHTSFNKLTAGNTETAKQKRALASAALCGTGDDHFPSNGTQKTQECGGTHWRDSHNNVQPTQTSIPTWTAAEHDGAIPDPLHQ